MRLDDDRSMVRLWLNGEPRPLAGPQSDLWGMLRHQRIKKWNSWLEEIQRERAELLVTCIRRGDSCAKELAELDRQRDIERVRRARVIGCTTTGAAIHHALLADARCGIVIIEEAAEVLEAHVLAALTPATKHVIMIGKRYLVCLASFSMASVLYLWTGLRIKTLNVVALTMSNTIIIKEILHSEEIVRRCVFFRG